MCGICGILNITGDGKIDSDQLKKMTDVIIHRGPDDVGYYIKDNIGLGIRRLSIIDLVTGHQPISNEDQSIWIVLNGEIYNFLELKDNLIKKGHRFRTKTDTEVIVHLYEEYGTECVKHLRGMFCFALWDDNHKRLVLAKDRIGIKPLYYAICQNQLIFGSEIKSILQHPLFEREIDLDALKDYFTFLYIPAPKTIFSGISKLLPGHILVQEDKKLTIKKYWELKYETSLKQSEDYFVEGFLEKLKEAVRMHLLSDVPLGAFLSGGIDSGSITAITSQYFKELKTFCIGFDLSSASGLELSFDERDKAERISYLYQTEHYEMVLKSGDMKRCLPHLVWALEDLRLGQSYPNFYASKLASRFVKVCLTGAGGDELFAGYPWRYYKVLRSKNFNEYIDGYYKYWQRLVPNRILKDLFSPIWDKVKGVWTEDIFKDVFSNHKLIPQSPEDYINHSLYFEAKTFLNGLFIVEDKLSMTHSLELRVPFLDNDLVDFALKLPIRLKLRDIDQILSIDEDGLAKRDKYFEKM